MNSKLGEKIKFFRKRAGLTQFNLELEIGLAQGAISRIESGKVNPTKETIADIAYSLKLDTSEIASLFGIEINDTTKLFQITTKLLLENDLKKILDIVLNDLIFKMGYIASAIFIIKNDSIYAIGVTKTNLSKKTFKLLKNYPLSTSKIPLNFKGNNALIQAISMNKEILINRNRDYLYPAIPIHIADKIQNEVGDRSSLIVPLSTNSSPFGAMIYTKKIHSTFNKERKLIKIITKQIAIAIENTLKRKESTSSNI